MKPPLIRTVAERVGSFLRHDHALQIEAESPTTLTLRDGRAVTVFDRLSRAVTQRGKTVATFGTMQTVHVREEPGDAGSMWCVTLHLSGSREVVVGRSADRNAATTVATHIATLAGVKLVA